MIVKLAKGYYVYSADRAKRLGGPFETTTEAATHMAELAAFAQAAKAKTPGGGYGGKGG